MGAIPRPVYYLRMAFRAIPALAGCAIALYWSRWLAEWGEVTVIIVLPLVFGFGMAAVYLLRPIRRRILLYCYEMMLNSGNRILMGLGIWELLRVAYRFWPGSPILDHVGFSTLHRIYDSVDEPRRAIILEELQRLEAFPNCLVASEANYFLAEIETPEPIA